MEYVLTPLEYCRLKTKESKSSFLAGFIFLPRAKREAMLVLYAFCREMDDVVDECSDAHVAQAKLNWWREQLALVYQDGVFPEHPVCQAMVPVVRHFKLPYEEFVTIIDGMQMDLQQVRYASFADLTVYCYHVAGVVGRLITRILGNGESSNQTLDYADKFGLALQLTNIIRDVGEDARLGRIYLPQEDLAHYQITENEILQAKRTTKFDELMTFQAHRALKIYQEALSVLPPEQKSTQKAGLVMGAIYYELLQTLIKEGVGKVLQQKLSLPGSRKATIAFKTLLFGFKL